MKRAVTLLLIGVLVAVIGCSKKSTPGGPGASLPPSEQSTIGQTADSFSLDTPTMSTKVVQGEAKTLAIGIKRGKNMDQDVTLMFNDLPKGVTVDPMAPVIKHGDTEAKVTLKAAEDAALGDFTVKALGHPATGPDATSDLKVTVSPK